MRSKSFRFVVLVPAAIVLAACSDTTAAGTTGQLSVQLTDAPNPMVQSATAYISTIYMIGGADTAGRRDTITNTKQSFDLLTLTNGVTAALGTATIKTGDYTQMRLIVDSATVTLKSPLKFSDGTSSKTLQTPSAQRTGIKVNFAGPVSVVPGQTILVVDFDVLRNFVFTGPSTGPTGVLFKPVLHATVQNVAASIAGTVTPASSKATLYALLNGDTVQTAMADTTTGAYKLRFLPPGAYSVSAAGTGLAVTKTLTLRAAQDTTGVNFP